jgi:hypothetical protein
LCSTGEVFCMPAFAPEGAGCGSVPTATLLSYLSGNDWQGSQFGWTFTLRPGVGPTASLTASNGTGSATYVSSNFSCLTGGTFTLTTDEGCDSFPVSFTLTKPPCIGGS